MNIYLNKTEQSLAINIAKGRYENARSKGKPDLKIGNQSNWQTDLEGIGGEIAVCKLFGVYPDTETELTELPKHDLVTKKGNTCDVKTTKYKNGKLLAARTKKLNDVDIYVLVVGQFPEYNVIGWAYSHELIKDENLTNLGHGVGYALEQSKLRKL
jgi:hypothetical protein